MIVQTSFTFRFADIEVHEPDLRVVRSGEPIAIEPKAFRVLTYLLRHAGHLVTKDELLHAVWGETAVTDNSLTRAIALLRRLLDDDPHQPRFIETISTAGYRFICPVEGGSVDGVESSASAHQTSTSAVVEPRGGKQGLRKRLWFAVVSAIVVLVSGAGSVLFLFQPLPMPRVTSYTQIASLGQWAGIAGTDYSNLYLDLFLPNGNGVVPVSGGRLIPISLDFPGSKDSPSIAPVIYRVSPDGSRFVVGGKLDPAEGRQLWVVDSHGGVARYLAKGMAVNWSPDGREIAYANLHGDLYTISSEGGDPRLLASLTQSRSTTTLSNLVWSPDGKRIRFVRGGRYWEISADGKDLHEVLPNWHATDRRYFMASGKWILDGDFFVFLAGEAGFSRDLGTARQLWILDERRRWPHSVNVEPVRLTNATTIWGEFAFSRDSKTIYCTAMNLRGELVRYETRSQRLAPFLGGISAEYVSYSRDGKYLAYVTFPDGTMWRANRDGSGIQKLTEAPFHPIAPEWSPDGTQILFSELGPSRRGELYLVSSQGGAPKRLLSSNKGLGRFSDWSPDGKKIVFDQIPVGTLIVAYGIWVWEGENSQIFDLDSRKFVDLPRSPKPGFSPRWSPDGNLIAEVASDHKSLLLLDLRTGHWTELDPKLSAMNFPRWSRDGRSIYVQDGDQAGVVVSTAPGIYRIALSSGKAEKVVDLKGFRGTGSISVGWSGLDPDDTPLLLRNVGTYDIYAITLERK